MAEEENMANVLRREIVDGYQDPLYFLEDDHHKKTYYSDQYMTQRLFDVTATGLEVHYRPDGTQAWVKDSKGNETHYREDGTREWTKDGSDGSVTIYGLTGENPISRRDMDGTITSYDENDDIHYTVDAKGVRRDRDGIEDNNLSRVRRKLAEKVGLEDVKTPKLFRVVESKASATLDALRRNFSLNSGKKDGDR